MIVTIDTHYTRPKLAAAYLMVEGDEAAFVETNTAHAVPRLLEALTNQGMTPDQVRYVVITHVHLDHAGGASTLMQACPKATLLAHPKAAKHAIDPTRLVASAKQVYGEDTFRELYGEIGPIDEARVRVMDDGEALAWGDRTLRFFYTRGHANHHFCIHDTGSDGVFTGDSFGLAYPELQAKGPFLVASTTPTDFDPQAARESARAIVDTGATKAFLTHFGAIDWLEEGRRQLVADVDAHAQVMEDAFRSDLPDGELEGFCKPRLEAHFQDRLRDRGLGDLPGALELLRMDIDLNAQGLAFAAMKRRKKAREAAGSGASAG